MNDLSGDFNEEEGPVPGPGEAELNPYPIRI
jgi:hypothetical protein